MLLGVHLLPVRRRPAPKGWGVWTSQPIAPAYTLHGRDEVRPRPHRRVLTLEFGYALLQGVPAHPVTRQATDAEKDGDGSQSSHYASAHHDLGFGESKRTSEDGVRTTGGIRQVALNDEVAHDTGREEPERDERNTHRPPPAFRVPGSYPAGDRERIVDPAYERVVRRREKAALRRLGYVELRIPRAGPVGEPVSC